MSEVSAGAAPGPAVARRGLMLVLSSPSGAGKTTISRALLDQDENLIMSVSATTRPMRPGEIDGTDYIFVSDAEFRAMVGRQELLEHAEVFGNCYGTPRARVEESLAVGTDVLFDIDWQGTQQLRDHEATTHDLLTVFVLPPSTRELEDRLRRRAQDPPDVVRQRMSKASDEMSRYAEYDYIVINDDLDISVDRVRAVLTAERLRRERQVGLHDFVQDLRDNA